MSCLPFECIQVVNIWPFRIPLLGQVAKLAGYLSVREMPVEEFIEAGSRLLAQGVSVITFPEGTRSGSRNLGPFHGSAFRLALHAGARVVPLAISGSENIPRRGSMLLRPGRIAVHKLPAIAVDELAQMPIFKIKMLVHEKIQEHLNVLEAVHHEQ
jgi:1-acyl-sn-glycerol-3-phosphate acyltransferase